MPQMSPASLIVHCLFEKKGDQWQAFSLEFGLAAQADSYVEASRKLEAMARSYVYDALVGEDKEHAVVLLARKATFEVYMKYYAILAAALLRKIFGRGRDGSNRGTYESPMPLMPANCTA
jgi:hypothetical protein